MNKANKKILLLSFLIAGALVLTVPTVSAHPASDMNLEYRSDAGTLEVEIDHSVGDPEEHYIDVVEIRRNGDLILSENYTSQPTNSTFSYTHDIDAAKGDTIPVYSHCNVGGDLSVELEVGTKQSQNGDMNLLLAAGVIVAIIVIVGIVYARMR